MTTAPPSPPVAPEPAQESQDPMHPDDRCTCGGEGKCSWCSKHCSVCGGNLNAVHLEHRHAPDCDMLASSGEAAGDGVTHSIAMLACGNIVGKHATKEILERYIRQQQSKQEQAEREAAEPKEQLALVERGFADLNDGCVELEKDRDAERAQKEALQGAIDSHGGLSCQHIQKRYQEHRDEALALRAERDELKDVLEQLRVYFQIMAQNEVTALGESAEGKAYRHAAEMVAAYRDEPNKQPAPVASVAPRRFSCSMPGCSCRWADPEQAAPVAKEEATAEAASRVLTKEIWDGWDDLRMVTYDDFDCPICGNDLGGKECVHFSRDIDKHFAEPVPQPPATAGGDRPQWLVNPAIELLNQCRSYRDIDSLLRAVEMLFEHNERVEFFELERRKP